MAVGTIFTLSAQVGNGVGQRGGMSMRRYENKYWKNFEKIVYVEMWLHSDFFAPGSFERPDFFWKLKIKTGLCDIFFIFFFLHFFIRIFPKIWLFWESLIFSRVKLRDVASGRLRNHCFLKEMSGVGEFIVLIWGGFSWEDSDFRGIEMRCLFLDFFPYFLETRFFEILCLTNFETHILFLCLLNFPPIFWTP